MTSQTMTLEAPSSPVMRLLATDRNLAGPALRLTLALVMFPHGAQKALGWFGGYGWSGTMGFLTEQIGLPTPLAALTILLEFLGPILLVAGLATRPVALSFAGIMLGAITSVHGQFGFFMNWGGNQAGEGFEYHLLLIGASVALALLGGGRWSVDDRLSRTRTE